MFVTSQDITAFLKLAIFPFPFIITEGFCREYDRVFYLSFVVSAIKNSGFLLSLKLALCNLCYMFISIIEGKTLMTTFIALHSRII